VGGELAGVRENELVIGEWSPVHLREKLKECYWKHGRTSVAARTFWEDSLRYLYLPRLKTHEALASVIRAGALSRDFFGTAYGEGEGKHDGFQFGEGEVSVNDTLLLIEPEAAKEYAIALKKIIVAVPPEAGSERSAGIGTGRVVAVGEGEEPLKPGHMTPARAKSFQGSVDVPAATAKMKLVQIAEEVVSLLTSDPNATVRVTIEITAEFPNGASDAIKRAVSENATSLGFKTKDWE
jgi:hypothetical protein